MPARALRHSRPVLTVLATLLIVVGEFVFLTLLYRSGLSTAVAEVIYATFLIFISVGWMVWFRQLVARHRAAEHELTEANARAVSERRLATLVRNSADVIAVCNVDSTVSFVTPAVSAVLGVAADDLIGGRLLDLVHPEDSGVLVQQLGGIRDDEQVIETRMQHADGRVLRMAGTLTNLLADPEVGGLVITVRDVTAQYELEQRLTHQAFHDSLTALANRLLFADRLDHALERRHAENESLVVLFCDLDDFKNVNDSLGHGTGDAVLVEIARRLRSVVRAADTVARFGGDEFAVLMETTELDTAREIADRLRERIAAPISVGEQTISITASIGLADAGIQRISAEEVLRNADIAMYLAKNRGKSDVAIYETQLHEEALERMTLRSDLQRALRDEEFVLYFQPTVALRTGEIAGFEALVRWQHPQKGLLPPNAFIPAAEQSGLIVPLGTWVLHEACRSAALLPTGDTTISINVAAKQLARADFPDRVKAALAASGLPASRLVLEITESDILQDLAEVTLRLVELRSLGVRIAIDDFGTGQSSLSYLSQLPVDVLKVDKSFIDRVTLHGQDAALTKAIIEMSQSMQLTTVAEGVESAEQARWLTDARCMLGQGYLWAKPVPIDEAIAMFSRAGSAVPVARAS